MTKPAFSICKQQRRRSACTSAQSDQRLCCLLPRKNDTYIRNFKPLPSFFGCAGQFVSYLVANLEDRISHDEAHIVTMMLFTWAMPQENLSSVFATRQDTNWPAQLQRPARILKFRIYKLEVSFCLGSEQQRRWSDCADAQADLRLCCSHMA